MLLVVGHDTTNLTDGFGGPQDGGAVQPRRSRRRPRRERHHRRTPNGCSARSAPTPGIARPSTRSSAPAVSPDAIVADGHGAAGLVVGVLFGLFGVGGSSFATPALGLLGVPGLVAVAAPSRHHPRRGRRDGRLRSAPASALADRPLVGHRRGAGDDHRRPLLPVRRWSRLLIASGVVLAAVGVRILFPLPNERLALHGRRKAPVVIPAAALIGLFTGLLANGGGFLLVPLFVLVLGLTMPESAGTSLVVIAVLSIPTLLTHWALGHIDWTVAAGFAAGSIPGASAAPPLAQHLPAEVMKRGFGVLLIAFAAYFLTPPTRRSDGDSMTEFTRRIDTDLTYEDAVAATKAALQDQGFGTLTEIDVRQTLKDKLDVDTAFTAGSSARATRRSPTAPSRRIHASQHCFPATSSSESTEIARSSKRSTPPSWR